MRDQQMNAQLPISMIGTTALLCLSLMGLGISAVIQGFLPFSPAQFAFAPLSSLILYGALVICIIKLEHTQTPYSARPYSELDSPISFYIYLSLLGVWSVIIVPLCWLRFGELSLRGVSLDEQIAAHPTLSLSLSLGAFVLYSLRLRAMDEKERLRANRVSPIPEQLSALEALAPGWNTSDIWRTVPMTDEDLAMVSTRDKESYRRRRELKLSTETQAVHTLRITDALASLQHSGSLKVANHPDELKSSEVNSLSMIEEIEAPAWLKGSPHEATQSVFGLSRETFMSDDHISRSVDDYDTRFEQSIVHGSLSNTDILADNKRWSGVSRPEVPPSRRSLTAGFTPLPVGGTPVDPLPGDVTAKDQHDSSPYSKPLTEHPHEIEYLSIDEKMSSDFSSAILLSGRRSSEDQALLDEVHQIISQPKSSPLGSDLSMTILDHQIYSEVHHLDDPKRQSSSQQQTEINVTNLLPLPKMSFSQLSELSCPSADSLSLELLNPTLVDTHFWDDDPAIPSEITLESSQKQITNKDDDKVS